MGDESSPIVRLSTRDVAPVDRLSYASWILGSALAPAAVSTGTPSQYELDVTALELPSIAIVAQSGSPQRAIRARAEVRRTSQRYFFLVLVLSGSWHVTNVTRTRLGPGDLVFYDSRYPLDCDLLLHWSGLNLQLSEQFVRKWVPNPAVLGWRNICRDSHWGRALGELRRPVVARARRASSAAAGRTDRSTRSVIGLDRERAKRASCRINAGRALGA